MKKILSCILLLFLTSNAYGHRVVVYPYVIGKTLIVECSFPSGDVCKGAKVIIYNKADGNKVIEGITDDRGKCEFDFTYKEPVKVVVDVGQGHRGQYTLNKNNLDGVFLEKYEEEENISETSHISHHTSNYTSNDACKNCISKEELMTIIDSNLRNIASSIGNAKKHSSNNISKAISGVGYIFGVFGLILYFKSKKKNAS